MTEKLVDLTCRNFIDAMSSSAPVPGGGGAVGMGGAMGVALVNMVIRLTVGKKKYAQYEDELQELLKKGERLQASILDIADDDAAAFKPLSMAYGLPKSTEAEKAEKARVLSAAAIDACDVPLQAAETLLEAIEMAERVAEIGSLLVISDVACGVEMLCAAVKCAEQNVLINLGSINDPRYVKNAAVNIKRIVLAAENGRNQTLKNMENRR
ncbi:MAG: cyclodeaminase/cyclohydrolase family protein [Bacillota bacterium]|jgi:formiminotetrahydrofolate cyclodeaminase